MRSAHPREHSNTKTRPEERTATVTREVDLHGYHPYSVEGLVTSLVRQAWEMGASKLALIHGWGKHSETPIVSEFIHTNTGYLGLAVRRELRSNLPTLRQWMYVKFETRDPGVTVVRLRPNPSATRTAFDEMPELDFP